MDITLHVWRQATPDQPGKMVTYYDEAKDISPDMSFLEMLDIVNERLIAKGEEPIAFEHDCREGICGSCGMMINGQAHGPQKGTATCQLHMRKFSDGDQIFVEPWRARAFPVLRDLVTDVSFNYAKAREVPSFRPPAGLEPGDYRMQQEIGRAHV